MSNAQGKFVWYELMTTDTAGAGDFYRGVLGWTAADSGIPGMDYTMLSMGEHGVGGLMALPPDAKAAGARPGWIGYVWVDDLSSAVDQVTREGGVVHRPPNDIPGVGKFAIIGDPQGPMIALFTGPDADMGRNPTPGAPGHAGWRELYAADGEKAFDFYSKLFGWTEAATVDMGGMGTYRIFAVGGEQAGGMMTKPPAVPAPYWLYYFNVAEINEAATRVRAGGGEIVNGPHEVPGGSIILQCLDPQGAMFALVEPRGG